MNPVRKKKQIATIAQEGCKMIYHSSKKELILNVPQSNEIVLEKNETK